MNIKIAIKIGIVASLSWFIGEKYSELFGRPSSLVGGLWCVLAAIVVVQENLGGTYKTAFQRLMGIAIGSLMGGFCTELLGSNPLSLGIAVAATVVFCFILKMQESFRIASLSVAVIMILWQLKPNINPWMFSFYRFVDSVLGVAIAMIVVHLVWPSQAAIKLKVHSAAILSKLAVFYRMSVSIPDIGERDRNEMEALADELQKLFQQNRALVDEAVVEMLHNASRENPYEILHEHLVSIYDSVLPIHKVYTRSIYEIFDNELEAQVKHLIEKTESTFEFLSLELINPDSGEKLVDISESIDHLKNDLSRFRKTHAIRQYSLGDVQKFFVFFYQLKSSAEELKKTQKIIYGIN